ncbi:DHH family phosphoesterase [Mesorhizobium sp. M7A.F.Ca.CA.001.11.2.1]|uniref:DHH family phosphoesterase n=1 Tax=Mesorhizobium sp. M7A.F.Ca.CA.001.11.2.1 TaxID=2496693 RepID=UPI000FC9EBAD|nr:DHH family phosphoesterase [Mesorhizobium sp. M7A.F.Ca.CA.001.11.2.1]RVA73792.1 single-stranded-DNA-specific exonuclease RecJ [Mesorhizobium sp. M7A.F.Ca.CA.001.11.2.1]
MTGEKRLFLDVRQSVSGVSWEHRLTERQDMIALAIAQGYGVSDIVARVLAGRGVTAEQTERFLDPTIRDLLPDPASLTDMDRAAARIAAAVMAREKVAIFGDYDVDGAASSALLKRFLTHFSVPSEIYIPDRIFEGYGPNPDAMRELVSRGATLIVTVDCGTNSAASIDAANEAGADVVVLDHHQVGGALPAAIAVVNPNRDDDLSGQGHLCAAGVVFLALVQTARILRSRMADATPPDLLSLLDIVALATVCDVVPLTGVNRAFVVKGLQMARQQKNEGLAALARVSRIGEPISTFHLAYLIGPRINAGGRIGDAALGSRLLATDDARMPAVAGGDDDSRAIAGLIVKGGGHGMAAGITVERARLGELRAFFEERAAADVFRLQGEESLAIDGALAAEGATLSLLDALEQAGPFGAGHVAPVFALPRHRLADARPVGTNHIRVELQSESGGRIQAIAFRAVDTALGEFLFKNRGKTIHVAGSLSGNYWNGNRTVQFRITDAARA